jgi:hypothetical protein
MVRDVRIAMRKNAGGQEGRLRREGPGFDRKLADRLIQRMQHAKAVAAVGMNE